MLKEISRFIDIPGVKVSISLERDGGKSTPEEPVYRGMVTISCAHAAARDEFALKMKAKQLGPIFLSGSADEIEKDIAEGRVLGRIQERVAIAREAEQADTDTKKKAAETKTTAPAKTAAKAAPVAKVAKTPEELKEIGKKATATAQTSLLDEAEATEEAKPVAKTPTEAKMATAQVGPAKNKKAKQFIDLVDELEFAVNSKSKKAAEEKIAKINALGKELNTLGLFKSDADAMAAYTKQKTLKAQAAELPEDDNDAPVFESEETEEATFED